MMVDLRRALRDRLVVLVTHDPAPIVAGDTVVELPAPASAVAEPGSRTVPPVLGRPVR